MAGQRLVLSEVDKRLDVRLNRSIGVDPDTDIGIMAFGEKNDYPQFMERVILSSIDARAIADIYSKFIIGQGFNDEINSVVVGKDGKGKDITILSLLRQFAQSASFFNGGYIHLNYSFADPNNPKVSSVKPIPFKNCRFTKPNDLGYCAKVAVYDNWEKDKNTKYDKNKIRFYHTYTNSIDVLKEQITNVKGVNNHKGHIYFLFLDNYYLYPLSPFDPVYMDCDTQAQISIFKNNQIRNGFTDKSVFIVGGDDENVEELKNQIKNLMGSNGDNCLIIREDIDPTTGKLESGRDLIADKISTTINDKLFDSWETGLVNNLRKANKAVPKILIDYETSNLGTTSGEAIMQAVNFYNAITEDDRAAISQMFKEIFSKFDNDILANNQDWSIKPLVLLQKEESKDDPIDVKLKSQAELKGSVGGVTALIQLQQSVAQGYTSIDAAIATLEEIYGIPTDIAKRMIGNPKEKTNGSNTNAGTATGQ